VYAEYAALGPSRAALQLDLFEQPEESGFFSNLLETDRQFGNSKAPEAS